jgi:hypothetical protein
MPDVPQAMSQAVGGGQLEHDRRQESLKNRQLKPADKQ